MLEFDSKDRIISFEDINLSLCASLLPCIDNLSVFHTNQMLNFQSNSLVHDTGIPKNLSRIKQDLSYQSFHGEVKCSIVSLHANKIFRIAKWSQNTEAIRFLNSMEVSHNTVILHQHIKVMNPNAASNQKYSSETIVRAFQYFSLSRACYNRLRQDLELPSVKALTRFTSITKNTDDQRFFRSVFSSFSEKQKSSVLLVDEVYAKPPLQFHGGNLFGFAVNKPSLLANTILTFMTIRLVSGPKFVCKIIPVRLDAQFLFQES